MHQNTIHKHFKNIKAHLNEAIRHDYFDLNKNPFLKYSPKRVATHKEPLTEKELEYLEQWTASSAERHLEPIRDFFLISCYSGLRFSDIQALNLRNFSDTPEGLFLSLEAQKTKKRYKVNSRLLFCRVGAEKSRLEMLLLKHIENMHGIETIPLLSYSNQYINRCLKQIFEQIPKIRIEFDEKISTHYGRHTFTNIMAKHVPAPILQKLLQHSSLQVTQGYINHSEDDLTNALSNVKIG